ncbi:hypothetical protein [uncultured Martelella sp.]|uniref:hypothetical protein n=1 Tax=uncultured Martelella sp. TaxID=392331 RepID=UPI0029C63995|nr:hypothetical protein [uncultured Martelella sp.]
MVMIPMILPRYVTPKTLASGRTAFYWNCPARYRKQGSPYRSAALGVDLGQKELDAAAAIWNERLDGWLKEQSPLHQADNSRFATVEWLVNAYQRHDSFLERVGSFSRDDYRRVFRRVCDARITRSDGLEVRFGDAKINVVGVSTAEKVYHLFAETSPRTAEKLVIYCKAAWKRMQPHHPDLFRTDTPNPWDGVTIRRRQKAVKKHATRAETYRFAEGALENQRPELAAAAVLAFEFLMRPSSISAGFAAWSGYRGESAPDRIIVNHRKTGQRAEHPLEYIDEEGNLVPLYPDAEKVLARTPRRGASIVCQRSGTLFGDSTRLSQDVRAMADRLAMPDFTLDAARHGGMTELEERGLTEGQGRVLSKHKTATAYRGYAKETDMRVLEATKKRMGHSEQAEKPSKIKDPKNAKRRKISAKIQNSR